MMDTENKKYKPYEKFSELIYCWIKKNKFTRYMLETNEYHVIWIKDKVSLETDNHKIMMICGGDNDNVYLSYHPYKVTYEELYEKYVFLDGSPCGREIEGVKYDKV